MIVIKDFTLNYGPGRPIQYSVKFILPLFNARKHDRYNTKLTCLVKKGNI